MAASVALLFSASCKKEYFTSANKNPNSPDWVQPTLYLPTVEGSLAYTQGGDLSRFASMFTQQTNGLYRQSGAYMNFVFSAQDVDNLWGNLYTSVMNNDHVMMHESDSLQCTTYSGISRVLMAYSLMLTVDNFGSVPYSQAFMGASNLQPVYDDDATLYARILTMCDSAIFLLGMTDPGAYTPGSEDAIFGGDPTLWTKFAHAVKARAYIHQSKNNAAMATLALNEIAQSFASNKESAIYKGFGTASTANSPWYQFTNQRGDISFTSSTLASAMLTNNDPRFVSLFDTTYYKGWGNDDAAPYYSGFAGDGSETVELITYEELQFIAAEATITKGGSVADAQTFYQAGINASMTKLGIDTASINSYIATNGTLSAGTALASICHEEWVALFLNPEVWTMYRRTGLPALTAPATASSSNIPRRLLYPQSESSYNKKHVPAGSTMYSPKVFWDK